MKLKLMNRFQTLGEATKYIRLNEPALGHYHAEEAYQD